MVASHPLAGVGPGRVPARFPEFIDAGFPVSVREPPRLSPPGPRGERRPRGAARALAVRAAGPPRRPGDRLGGGALVARPGPGPGPLRVHPHGSGVPPVASPGDAVPLLGRGGSFLASGTPGPLASRALSPARLLPWLLLLWAVPRLLLAPGTERSRFGFAEWGSRGGEPGYFWTGPSALVPVALPADGAVVVRARAMYADVRKHPVLLAVSLDGGPVTKVSLSNRTWQDVLVERGPLRPGDSAGRAGPKASFASRRAAPSARPGTAAATGGSSRSSSPGRSLRTPEEPAP